MRILWNEIMCNYCGKVITSKYYLDRQTCPCGACTISGGLVELQRESSNLSDYTELSLFDFSDEKEEKHGKPLRN